MSSISPPTRLFGTAAITELSKEDGEKMFAVLEKHQVKNIDTAYIYPNSEESLKGYGAPSRFIIDTKAPGFRPGVLSKQSILASANESLQRLGISKIHTYYFHAPDTSVPIEESLSAITQLHAEGKFENFGLSNFKAEQVQEVYDLQKKNGGPLPTAFQGHYNAVSRHIEADLFPTLRKLGISFNAYSPIAGGFLVKSAAGFRDGSYTSGRFAKDGDHISQMYNSMYSGESLIKALDTWEQVAKDEGVTKAALAYRWIAFHSALKEEKGDGIIIGASKVAQLEESLAAIEKGPLSKSAAERIDQIWKDVQEDSPLDCYHSYAIKGSSG